MAHRRRQRGLQYATGSAAVVNEPIVGASDSTGNLHFFVLAAILLVAAGIRIGFDNVEQFSPADETVYVHYITTLSNEGLGAYPAIVRSYVADQGSWIYPSPVRWSFLLAGTSMAKLTGSATHHTLALLSTTAGLLAVLFAYLIAMELFGPAIALITAALAATSPLSLALGRRALSDQFFCTIFLVSIYLLLIVVQGERRADRRMQALLVAAWILTTAAVFAAKEQFLLIYPFVLLFWWLRTHKITAPLLAIWAAPPMVYFLIFAALSRSVDALFRIARIVTAPPVIGASYAIDYQSGPPQRVLIDFLAIEPIVTVLAIAAVICLLPRLIEAPAASRHIAWLLSGIVAVHMLFPSKNLRYVISADPLMRLCVAAFFWDYANKSGAKRIALGLLLAVNAAVELAIFHRVFVAGGVYDPVTQNLIRALGMGPH